MFLALHLCVDLLQDALGLASMADGTYVNPEEFKNILSDHLASATEFDILRELYGLLNVNPLARLRCFQLILSSSSVFCLMLSHSIQVDDITQHVSTHPAGLQSLWTLCFKQ